MTAGATTSGATTSGAFEAALGGGYAELVGPAAMRQVLPVDRWHGAADAADRALLAHCTSAAIDLGCGPGRMAQQLAHDGVRVLAVDQSPVAVHLARARGVQVLLADVLGWLPGEGTWSSALLADGNIGIGGDPVRLLRRTRRLLGPGGRVVVELAPPGTGVITGVVEVRTRAGTGGTAGTAGPFAWAVLGVGAVHRVAAEARLEVLAVHHVGDRWFAVLTREGGTRW